MKVLGPYLFQTHEEAESNNCGCGGDYCNLLNFGDKITFQIPSSETCQEFLAGCTELFASCITEQELSSTFTFEQNSGSICFDLLVGASPGQIEPEDSLFTGQYLGFEYNTTYKICFAFSNNVVPDDNFTLFINDGTNDFEGALIYQGNGTFCGYIKLTGGSGALPISTWGIRFKGGDDTVRLCVEAMTLCLSSEYQAEFVKEDEPFSPIITKSFGKNGNIIFNYSVTEELNAGCYYIRLLESWQDVQYNSNCINLLESHPCTILLKWRNNNNAFGYDYSDPNYTNYARVQARLKFPRWPWEKGDYLMSNNRNELTNAQQSEITLFVTGRKDNVASKGEPEYMHRAIANAILSDVFTIDDVLYRLNGSSGTYEPAWRNSSNLAHVEVELIDQNYDGINRYCS